MNGAELEVASRPPRATHLVISAGNTALSGALTGVEMSLLEHNPDVGLYLGVGAIPLIAFMTLTAVAAWKAFHDHKPSIVSS